MSSDTRQTGQETERKLKLATDALVQLASQKQRSRAWGQVSVKLFWENGCLKTVEINDTTTIRDSVQLTAVPDFHILMNRAIALQQDVQIDQVAQ